VGIGMKIVNQRAAQGGSVLVVISCPPMIRFAVRHTLPEAPSRRTAAAAAPASAAIMAGSAPDARRGARLPNATATAQNLAVSISARSSMRRRHDRTVAWGMSAASATLRTPAPAVMASIPAPITSMPSR
jgi:hypothetical protein